MKFVILLQRDERAVRTVSHGCCYMLPIRNLVRRINLLAFELPGLRAGIVYNSWSVYRPDRLGPGLLVSYGLNANGQASEHPEGPETFNRSCRNVVHHSHPLRNYLKTMSLPTDEIFDTTASRTQVESIPGN